MATAIDMTKLKKDLYGEMRRLANEQFDSPQYQRLLNIPLNVERARHYVLQKGFWNLNRRDCWAFAQGLAPMDVKALIWEHELDELQGNEKRGVEDHYSLQVRQASTIGLTRADFENEVMRDETRAIIYAYIHLAKDTHWLYSVATCAALEVSNSSDWVAKGGMSYRWGKKQEAELGIPFHKQLNAKEHAEVDVEHGNLMTKVIERHCDTPAKLDIVLDGLKEAWALDRAWKGILAGYLEGIPGPKK
jgi:hypothetical protein